MRISFPDSSNTLLDTLFRHFYKKNIVTAISKLKLWIKYFLRYLYIYYFAQVY